MFIKKPFISCNEEICAMFGECPDNKIRQNTIFAFSTSFQILFPGQPCLPQHIRSATFNLYVGLFEKKSRSVFSSNWGESSA
jgi:hypothetical protein